LSWELELRLLSDASVYVEVVLPVEVIGAVDIGAASLGPGGGDREGMAVRREEEEERDQGRCELQVPRFTILASELKVGSSVMASRVMQARYSVSSLLLLRCRVGLQ
jgi:hypothetical protein